MICVARKDLKKGKIIAILNGVLKPNNRITKEEIAASILFGYCKHDQFKYYQELRIC